MPGTTMVSAAHQSSSTLTSTARQARLRSNSRAGGVVTESSKPSVAEPPPLGDLRSVRLNLVDRARREIAVGTYITEHRLDGAVSRLIAHGVFARH